jgi:hypothetical protein
MSDVRCQMTPELDREVGALLPHCIFDPSPDRCFGCQDISLRSAGTTCPGVSSHTHAQAQPDGTARPASRSRLASRCRRSDDRCQMSDGFETGMDRRPLDPRRHDLCTPFR